MCGSQWSSAFSLQRDGEQQLVGEQELELVGEQELELVGEQELELVGEQELARDRHPTLYTRASLAPLLHRRLSPNRPHLMDQAHYVARDAHQWPARPLLFFSTRASSEQKRRILGQQESRDTF